MELNDNNFYSIHNSYIVIKKINNKLHFINIRGWKGETTIFSLFCDHAEIAEDYSKLVCTYNGLSHEIALYGKFGVIIKGSESLLATYHKLKDCINVTPGYEAISCMKRNKAIFVNDYKNEGYYNR